MARRLSVARTNTLIAVSVSPSQSNVHSNRSGGQHPEGHKLIRHKSDGGILSLSPPPSGGENEERGPTIIHVDHRLIPLRPTLQSTLDPPQITAKLSVIRESTISRVVSKGDGDSSPLDTPSHSSIQQALLLLPDNAVTVSGLMSSSPVVNQFSHSSNSKTKLDVLAEVNSGKNIVGSGKDKGMGGSSREGTPRSIVNDMNILPSSTAAVVGATTASRRGTRQVTSLTLVPLIFFS